MDSIIQDNKQCFVCAKPYDLHSHHICYGTSNRKQSEKYGLKVWLCVNHHTGAEGVHHNRDFDIELKKIAQTYFEATHGTREEFRSIFGKSYL